MDALVDSIVKGLQAVFKNNYLIVFIVSMIPMVEVRGAIPIGVGLGMNIFVAAIFSAISALIMCPVLILCLKPIINYLKTTKLFKKIAEKVEHMFVGKAKDIEKNADEKKAGRVTTERQKNFYKTLTIFIFVAVPLPGTGVWTSSAIAAFLDLKYRYSIPAIFLGNMTAATIISLLTHLLGDKSYLIMLVLFVFILITVASLLITLFFKSRKRTNAEENIDKPAE